MLSGALSRTVLIVRSALLANSPSPSSRRGGLGLSASPPPPLRRRGAGRLGPMSTSVAVRDTVELEDSERALFDTLLAASRHHGLPTVLRCAGGWVRDKLLGTTSPDIDVALDDMLGREFAEKVNAYLEHRGEDPSGVGVIRVNPDQSKHLETATMKVEGRSIDLVNLRSETYAKGSRIPQVRFGTPEEDALRRDLTINALFYNLNTARIGQRREGEAAAAHSTTLGLSIVRRDVQVAAC